MRSHHSGFTLLEILVVMVIIGIATTAIMFSVGDLFLSNRRSEVMSREVATLIELARNQAIFSLTTIGMEIGSGEYHFVQLDNTSTGGLSWKSLGKRDAFWNRRTIPSNIIMQVSVKDTNVKNLLPTNSVSPQIIIFPSGEMTPFKITIHSEGSSQLHTIEGNYAGTIKVTSS